MSIYPDNIRDEEGRKLKRGCMLSFIAWCAGLVLLFICGSVSRAIENRFEWMDIFPWALSGIIIPSFGVLYAINLKKFLDWESQKNAVNTWFRSLIILGLWLLALLSACVGITIAYAAIRETGTPPEKIHWIGTTLILMTSLILLGAAWLLFKFPLRKNTDLTKSQQHEAFARWQARFNNPDFAGIESAIGHSLPEQLKQMIHADSEWHLSEWTLCPSGEYEHDLCYTIAGIEPLDLESLWRLTNPQSNEDELYLIFATNDFGYYLLKVVPEDADPAVFQTNSGFSIDNEVPPGTFPEKIADHFSQFISWPKKPI